MSLKKEWLAATRRVVTKDGFGELVSYGPLCEVMLDEPVAGKRNVSYRKGEVAIDSDFFLVEIIHSWAGLISNAQSFLTWKECLGALHQPFAQDVTRIALNFKTRRLQTIPSSPYNPYPYRLLEASIDQHSPMEDWSYDDTEEEEARKAWEEKIDCIDGTSGQIFLCALVNVDEERILARGLFGTMAVLKRETWW